MIEIKRGIPCIKEKGRWLKFATMDLAEAYLNKNSQESLIELNFRSVVGSEDSYNSEEEECLPLADEIL